MKRNEDKSKKDFGVKETAKSRRLIRRVSFFVLTVGILVSALLCFRTMPLGTAATEPVMPGGYGLDFNDWSGGMVQNETKNGLKKTGDNSFQIIYNPSTDENGFITISRLSQSSDLSGYTFHYATGGSVPLGVEYDENNDVVIEKSFFGIGSESYPFKGTITVAGATDTVFSIANNGWRFLFNNISNEASIPLSSGSRYVRISYSASGSSTIEGRNSFEFAKKLTVTSNGTMDVSGLQFGQILGEGAVVLDSTGTENTALFAGEVVCGGGTDLSVDLSGVFALGGTYYITNNTGNAAAVFGKVNKNVNATVILPQNMNCEVTAGNNAGLLAGVVEGKVEFGTDLTLTGSATGHYAGGLAGSCNGEISVKNVNILNSTFSGLRSDSRVGGAVGDINSSESAGVVIAEGCTMQLSGNNLSAESSCRIGGYAGSLTTSGASLDKVVLSDTTITGSSTSDKIGGYIGYLETQGETQGNYTVNLNGSQPTFSFGSISGTCGGVIGEVNSTILSNTVLIENSGELSVTVANGDSATVGGFVGKLSSGYLKLDNVSATNNIQRKNPAADLVGAIADGAILDVGNVTIEEANGSVLVAKTGRGSVVRLSGNIRDNSGTVKNIVFEQNSSLIYADTGFSYTGNASQDNDIGNYGQVFRNDALGVIILDSNHVVSVADKLDASGEITVAGAADFAKLAITFYTEGTISGVQNASYNDLFEKTITINLASDIFLAGKGIEQLTPANCQKSFTGTINGGGKTITLAIGQGLIDNSGVKIGTNNARKNIGLFSRMSGATVNELNIGGTINTELSNAEYTIGSIAGVSEGSLSFTNCGVGTVITATDGTVGGTANKNIKLYAGGAVGKINSSAISVTGCTFNPEIKIPDSGNNSQLSGDKLYLGGLAGYVNYSGNGSINLTDNTIGTKITKVGSASDLRMGGLVGELTCTNYTLVDLSGTTANGVSLTAESATGSMGGILGRTFKNCRVKVNGSFSGTVKSGAASLGGLIYNLEGRLDADSGTSVDGLNLTSSGSMRGILLADGKKALVTVSADPGGFDAVTADGFDLFVGENVTSYTTVDVPATGGIVTIETQETDVGKFPEASGWYGLINSRQNTKTRYYFNVAKISPPATAGMIASPTDLLYWNIYDYSNTALIAGVKNEYIPTLVNDITASADVDMTNYCLYPTAKEGVTVDFKGHTLTFGQDKVTAQNQFYGLQAGLLSDIIASDSNRTSTVQDIKLSGTVAYLNGGASGSGALICGTVHGAQVDTNVYTATLNLSNIVLSGVAVEGNASSLLVNRVGSHVQSTIDGISQSGYAAGTKVASSLIGKGGYNEGTETAVVLSQDIYVTLKNIVLEGVTSNAIFSDATLFDDIKYQPGAGSFVYNFNLSDDWNDAGEHKQNVTYGKELTLNEDQQKYYDCEIFVNPNTKPTADSTLFDFSTGYLPYVHVTTDGSTNTLLSVNRKVTDFIEGWGTYQHPYIITSAKQLETLARLLSGSAMNNGWQINLPRSTGEDWSKIALENGKLNLSYLDLESYTVYTAQSGTNPMDILTYLAGAYYKLSPQSSYVLSSGFGSGIGSETYPFHGVIHGNGSTVNMPGASDISGKGYGFINVANGCAVYDLTVNYSGSISLSTASFTANDVATPGPLATDISQGTALPHFGGVIAWIVGGDNKLDTVKVTAVNSVSDPIAGAAHTVCGGYVGLISGGGVLLKNLTATENVFSTPSRLYHNNYVGRVLNGYAIAVDGRTYDNEKVLSGYDSEKRGDFRIPSVNSIGSCATPYSDKVFTINSPQDLLFLSYGMNCGAFVGTDSYAYGKTSLSRTGDYSNVGKEDYTSDEITAGKYKDDTDQLSVFAKYFGFSSGENTSLMGDRGNLTINLVSVTYDMTQYKNGFRGMSGAYFGDANDNNAKRNNSPRFRIAYFGNPTEKATISVDMDMLQYQIDTVCEKDSIVFYGIIAQTDTYCPTKFSPLNLVGKVSLQYIDANAANINAAIGSSTFNSNNISASVSVGGLLGRSNSAVEMADVSLTVMTICSPDIAGGFLGQHSSGNLSIVGDFIEVKNEIRSSTVTGKRHTGCAVGLVSTSGAVTVEAVDVSDSLAEVVTKSVAGKASDAGGVGVGGIVGAIISGSNPQINNCTVSTTAVVFYSSNKNASFGGAIGSGGLVGRVMTPITANSCMVDGCVIFSLSCYLDNSKYVFEYAAGNDVSRNLPSDMIDNVIARGDKSRTLATLGYLISEKASRTTYASGAGGGLFGCATKDVTVSGCKVTALSAPLAIAASDGAAGIMGEHRTTDSSYILSVENSSVFSDGHDLFIVGDTRAAGIVAYRENKNIGVYNVDNFQVCGTAEHPVRMLAVVYNGAWSGGLFGDTNKINLNISNSRLDYCIVGGSYSSGVLGATNNGGSTVDFKNVHLSHSLVYSVKGNYTGGIIGNVGSSGNVNVRMDGVYSAYNHLLGTSGAGGLVGNLANGTVSASYVILDENVTRQVSKAKVSDFTLASRSLVNNEAVTALVNTSSLNNSGLIAAKNSGTCTAIAVSCNAPDFTQTANSFGSDTGTGIVVYAAYGASEEYEKYGYKYVNFALNEKTPQQEAIEAMNCKLNGDDRLPLYGDSVTSAEMEDNSTKPTYNVLNNDLPWWMYTEENGQVISKLGEYDSMAGVTQNLELQLLSFDGDPDEILLSYLNVLTGKGFGDTIDAMKAAISGGTTSPVTVGVTSKKYSVADDGSLSEFIVDENVSVGSVIFDSDSNKFKPSPEGFDNLDGNNKVLTILSFKFTDQSAPDVSYTMDVAIYFQRSIDLKTYIVPLDGENYYIPAFTTEYTGNAASNPLMCDIVSGSPVSLYVEYNYNDVAKSITQFSNIKKQIELLTDSGTPNTTADPRFLIEQNTRFILIDLNSSTPSGYTYYEMTLGQDSQYIDFDDFVVGEEQYKYINLSDLPESITDRFCKDNGSEGEDCIYTERYLLVAFPVANDNAQPHAYNMRAVINEADRQKYNVKVNSSAVYAKISVWAAPVGEMVCNNNDNGKNRSQFSIQEDEPLYMHAIAKTTLSADYYKALTGQGKSGKLYESHRIALFNEQSRAPVNLPAGTKITVTNSSGEVLYRATFLQPTSTVAFSVGNILENFVQNGDSYVNETEYSVSIDFSGVSVADFNKTFDEGSAMFTLNDEMYLSSSGNATLNTRTSIGSVTNYKAIVSKDVVLVVTPKDNRYLGINLNDPSDETNNGKINFTVIASIDTSDGKQYEKGTLTFELAKKVYGNDSTNNDAYYYKSEPFESGITWKVVGESELSFGSNIDNRQEAIGEYVLEVGCDGQAASLTNYRLIVTLTAQGTDANNNKTEIKKEAYFVFLVCDLNNTDMPYN